MKILSMNWKTFAEKNLGKAETIGVGSFGNWSDPILRKFRLRIPFSKGEIVFNTSEFKPLKITYQFSKDTDLEFLIYPEDFTDKIIKLFGCNEIEIDDDEFDEHFFIKSKHEIFIRKLLTPQKRKFLLNNYISNFKIQKTNKVDILELTIVINELELSEMELVLNFMKECITFVEEYRKSDESIANKFNSSKNQH